MSRKAPVPKTHWRSEPPQPMLDVVPPESVNSTAYAVSPFDKLKFTDVRAREKADTGYLSPVIEARQSRRLWESFLVSANTSRLPHLSVEEETLGSMIVDAEESTLPLEKPHAVALGLAILLIALGLLSFQI
jgi:hypothetical protein